MPASSSTLKREIRVFISSTFSDMQQERNYLVKKIFPDIERECRKRNVEFIALDLRWGITEEEAKHGKVVEICINEIDRTRPFFIGLLGGRYGWVPGSGDDFDPERISQNMPWIRPYLDGGISITEMEMRYGVLDCKIPIYASFFIRKDKDIPKKYREGNPSLTKKLQNLKNTIRAAAKDGLCTVTDYGSVKSLGESVRKQLMDMVDRLFPKEESLTMYDLFAAHQEHSVSELRRFHHPRVQDLLNDLNANNRLLLCADSYGSGLSAIAANEIPDDVTFIDKDGKRHQPRVIRSFVDMDVNSMEVLKRMFVNSLHKVYPEVYVSEIYRPIDEMIDFKGIVDRFPKEEYLWIVDSPENFSDVYDRTLNDLLKKMDFLSYVVIVSSDSKIREICSNNDVFIKTVGRPTEKDLVAITTNYLRHYGKSLSERQKSAIIGSGILTNIKMLVVFLDILRNFGVYEDVDKFIHSFVSLNSEKDFYNRYFEYLEDEFSEAIVAEVFRRLQVLDMGISEKGLLEGLLSNRIEQSSFMSVIENLLSRRFHNYIFPVNSIVAQVASTRYPIDKKDFQRISNLLIRDYQRRMKEIVSDKSKSLFSRIASMSDQLLMRGYRVLEDNGLSTEWGMLRSTVIILLIRNGCEKKALRMMRHYGIMNIYMYRPKDISYIIDLFRRGKYKPYSMVTTFDILTSKYISGDFFVLYIWDKFNSNENDKATFLKKMTRKPLPARWKSEIVEIIKGGYGNTMFLDLWDEDFDFENEEMDSRQYLALLNQAPSILHYGNLDYVRQIFEKLHRTYSKLDNTNPIKLTFLRAALFCSIRLNDKNKFDALTAEISENPLATNIENDRIFADIMVNLIKNRKTANFPAAFIDGVIKFVEMLTGMSNDRGSFNLLVCKAIIQFYQSREKGVPYSTEEIISLIKNRGWIIDTFYFNCRKDIAVYFLPAFLETDLSIEDRTFYLRMYADSLKETGYLNEAIEEYRKALATAEANNLTNGSVTVQSILCEIMKYYTLNDDFEGFEYSAKRLIEYAEAGKYECDKATAFNQVSNGYFVLSDNAKDNDSIERARNKAMDYSRRAYKEEPTNWILWSNYAGYLKDFRDNFPVNMEDLKIFIEEGKRLMVSNSVSDENFIENLGKLFVIAEMEDDFDNLKRQYPSLFDRNDKMSYVAGLLATETNPDIRKEHLDSLIYHIQLCVFRCITYTKIIPLDSILSTIKQSGEGEKIASRFYEDSVSANGKLRVYEMMLAASIFRSLGDKERGDMLEQEVATYLLEGKGRFNKDDYVSYGLFQSDCPYNDYLQTRKYIMDRFISKDIVIQEQHELAISALYDSVKAKEYVEMSVKNGSDFNQLLENVARLFIKYGCECSPDAFVQFCDSVNTERKNGRQLPQDLIKTISDAAEKITETLIVDDKVLYLDGWQIIEELLHSGNIELGRNMVINGLYITDARRQYDLYTEYYLIQRNEVDYSVVFVYLSMLYDAGNMELYEKILADLELKVTSEDKAWPSLQVELAINYRRVGKYSEAMEAFKRLSDYCDRNNKAFTDYIYILYPLITSLLGDNYEEYHVQSDRVKAIGVDQNLIVILNCTYYLKVDNYITADRMYKAIRPKLGNCYIDTGEMVPQREDDSEKFEGRVHESANDYNDVEAEMEDEANLDWGMIEALTSYRFIELARYHLRHKEEENAKAAYLIADRLLQKLQGKYPYFHNELNRLRCEIPFAD